MYVPRRRGPRADELQQGQVAATSFRGTACRQKSDSGTPIFKTGLDAPVQRRRSSGGARSAALLRVARLSRTTTASSRTTRCASSTRTRTSSTPLGTTTDVSTSLNFVDMSTHLGADVGRVGAARRRWSATRCSFPPASRASIRTSRRQSRRRCTTTPTGSTASRGARRSTTSSRDGSRSARCSGIDYTDRGRRARSNTSRRRSSPRSCRRRRRAGASVKRFGARPLITADYIGTAKADLSSALVVVDVGRRAVLQYRSQHELPRRPRASRRRASKR